jgi:4-hydroxybenzoate polyprenyltransferase
MLPFLKLIRWVTYSNLWVSTGALFFAASVYLQFNHPIDWKVCSLVFLACLFLYTFQRVFRSSKIYTGHLSSRHRWIVRNIKLLWTITLLAFAGASFLALQLIPLSLFPFFAAIGIIGILYVTPLFKLGTKTYRLRDFPIIKPFLISAVWVAICVYLPVAVSEIQVPNEVLALTFIIKGLFIFAIAVPFDIRDVKHDTFYNTQTFPVLIGIENSIQLVHLSLVLACGLTLFSYFMHWFDKPTLNAFLISFLSTGFVISQIKKGNKGELFYSFVIDGALLDHFVWFALMSFIMS